MYGENKRAAANSMQNKAAGFDKILKFNFFF
jgi:hypothetical protein